MAIVGVGSSLGGLSGGNATARLLVVVSGDSRGLTSALAGATGSLNSFNQNAERIGNTLIRSLTLPTLALGGAAIKMAMDYESAMARVAGLTTLTADQVVKADQRILDMAKRVPVAPTELAESLYFAGSAGLQFEEAMQVVEASANAAAIGMGNAEDISKVLIFSLNAYRGTGLTAARAMDVFTAAIKEGTAGPDELALALGRLLPVARQAGVEFETAVASIATLTNIGLPTRVAATSLRALFGGLLAPTNQATESLAELGVTTEQLRDAVDAGPLVAFKLLENAVGGNDDMLRKIIPQIRAFTAYLGLSGKAAERTAGVYNNVRNSAGDFEKAVAKIAKTPQFKFQIALNKLRVAGIEMGRQLMPMFMGLVRVISAFAEELNGLGSVGKSVLVFVGTLAASLGPLIKLWGVLNASGAGFLANGRAIATGFATMGMAALVAKSGFGNLADGSVTLGNALITTVATFTAVVIAIKLFEKALNFSLIPTNRLTVGLLGLTKMAGPIALLVAGLTTAVGAWIGSTKLAEKMTEELGASFEQLGASATLTKTSIKSLAGGVAGDLVGAIAAANGMMGQTLGQSLPEITQKLKEMRAELGKESNFEKFEGFLGGSSIVRQSLDAAIAASEGATKSFEDQAKSRILFQGQEEAAVKKLADEYGVSMDFAGAQVQEFGVSAQDLKGDVKQSFVEQAGWVEKSTGRQVAAMLEAQQKERKIIAQRQDAAKSLLGTFFEKDVASIEGSTEQLIANTTKQTQALVAFAGNVNALRLKGLDPGALQFLVDQGPGMVAKFVDASDAELRRLETNYYTSLGAIDAAIVNEGKHEEVKGRKNVQLFSQGMLSNRALPVAAASRIVGQVTQALISGKIKQAAVKDITQFADRLEALKHLPKEAAVGIMDEFIKALMDGDFEGAGAEDIRRLANGIASAAGLPKGRTQEIASQLVGILRGIAGSAFGAGANVSAQFAAGLAQNRAAIIHGVGQLAQDAKDNLDNSLRGSPKFFTYYLGHSLAESLSRGMMDAGLEDFKIGDRRSLQHGKAGIKVKDRNAGSGSRLVGSMTITNWKTGAGHFEGRIVDTMDSNDRHNRRLSRMKKK